jgi:putative lipoprotein
MNKLLWLCGIVAFTVVSCTEGNWGKVKEKDALGMYDSVLIERDPGFSCRLTEDYWMLYKNGTVTKCTRSPPPPPPTVRFSDANGRRVKYLIDDIYVKGTAKDIVAVVDNNYCSDLGGLYIYFYYPGKTVQYQYDWGQTGVKYSSEFKKLMKLLKVYYAE